MKAIQKLLIFVFIAQGALAHASRSESAAGGESTTENQVELSVASGQCVLTPSGLYKILTPADQSMPVVRNPRFKKYGCDTSHINSELVRTAYMGIGFTPESPELISCLAECGTTWATDHIGRAFCEAECMEKYEK